VPVTPDTIDFKTGLCVDGRLAPDKGRIRIR
jgi:hypothetical protein